MAKHSFHLNQTRNTMTLRNLLTLFSMTLLVGLTACSTTGEAEADEPAEQTEQAQTQQQTDDHTAHHPEEQQAESAQMADKQQMMAKMCPMQVEGTTRQVVKLDGAVAMDFTTTGDVDELRQRVPKMAQMHQKMHGEGAMMQGGMDGGKGQMQHGQMQHGQMQHGQMQHGQMQHGQMHGQMTEEQRQMRQQMMQMMADVTVDTEEIENGMRMKFTPKDGAQADRMYQMMQKHAQMMGEDGQCPMMQMMGGGPMEGQPE
jgi:hypothetical protein